MLCSTLILSPVNRPEGQKLSDFGRTSPHKREEVPREERPFRPFAPSFVPALLYLSYALCPRLNRDKPHNQRSCQCFVGLRDALKLSWRLAAYKAGLCYALPYFLSTPGTATLRICQIGSYVVNDYSREYKKDGSVCFRNHLDISLICCII